MSLQLLEQAAKEAAYQASMIEDLDRRIEPHRRAQQDMLDKVHDHALDLLVAKTPIEEIMRAAGVKDTSRPERERFAERLGWRLRVRLAQAEGMVA